MARGLCSTCGSSINITASSRPEPVCHPCRRRAWGLGPDEKVNDLLKARRKPRVRRSDCRRCGNPVPDDRVAYCSSVCARKRHGATRPRPSTAGRGYGTEHKALRARLLPQAYGQDCHLCGAVMLPTQELHLDHTEDRQGYRGFAHAWCNSADGLRRAQEALRQKRLAGRAS